LILSVSRGARVVGIAVWLGDPEKADRHPLVRACGNARRSVNPIE
jgi:hypothetical protein